MLKLKPNSHSPRFKRQKKVATYCLGRCLEQKKKARIQGKVRSERTGDEFRSVRDKSFRGKRTEGSMEQGLPGGDKPGEELASNYWRKMEK